MSVDAVIPTLGQSGDGRVSGLLAACLESVVAEREIHNIFIVAQEVRDRPTLPERARWIDVPQRLGFAAAVNLGLAQSTSDWVAVINDDAELQPGWTETLLRTASNQSARAVALQALNLTGPAPTLLVDGAGLGWNHAWQAIQIDHGRPSPGANAAPDGTQEVFGVAATAALYDASALRELTQRDGAVFDARLDSYYEDVDLAVRLWLPGASASPARTVPSARVLHRGSATGMRPDLSRRRWEWIYGNRRLVVARLLGRSYADARGAIERRDRRDLLSALRRAEFSRCVGLVRGIARARRLWSQFAHDGPPRIAPAQLSRFGAPLLPAVKRRNE